MPEMIVADAYTDTKTKPATATLGKTAETAATFFSVPAKIPNKKPGDDSTAPGQRADALRVLSHLNNLGKDPNFSERTLRQHLL